MKKLFVNNKMSGILHIIGAVISANLLTFIVWLISGISILSYNKTRKKCRSMKYTWWILLTIAGILSLISVYGFILCVGSFGMVALNVMWLFVYTP